MPHSTDREYAERAIPQYERAVTLAGGEPVRIPLDQTTADMGAQIATCAAVLLPGSKADVNPSKFQQAPAAHTAAADPLREQADFLLLADALAQRKPVLGICYGLQSLNVFRGGSLIQHIPDFLPEQHRWKVNHEAGKKVAIAHDAEIAGNSLLARIVMPTAAPGGARGPITVPVNSSHHQSADAIGQGLRIVARCPADGIVEALEGISPEQFLLAVQWHPERSVDDDEPSRAIFQALIEAAR